MARLAYLGTPDAAVPPLEALVHAGHDVALVVTRRDARRGRGGRPAPSPVKRAATELGLRVSDRLDDVLDAGAELGVVVAYGRLVPARVLNALDLVNVHFSLLPRWRGAAPVERAILAGDDTTGVSLMRLDDGLDTGPVLATRSVAIEPGEHASVLRARLAVVGAGMLVELLDEGVDKVPPGRPQEGQATYAAKIDPGELCLDWTRPATELERVVRLDRAWTTFRGARLRVLDAGARPGGDAVALGSRPGTLDGTAVTTGSGVLELRVVQSASGRPVDAQAWARGARLAPGERLGGPEEGHR